MRTPLRTLRGETVTTLTSAVGAAVVSILTGSRHKRNPAKPENKGNLNILLPVGVYKVVGSGVQDRSKDDCPDDGAGGNTVSSLRSNQ